MKLLIAQYAKHLALIYYSEVYICFIFNTIQLTILKYLVIIPTYNELENIQNILEAVFELPRSLEVLVVDDSSPDGTAQVVKEQQKRFPKQLHLLERKEKDGLGRAYIAGFHWALAKGYDFIFEMDADFSHPPADLINLLEACEAGADVSIGSRYTKGGGVKNWPWDRIALSYGASLYVRLITWMNIKDPTAGFVCYSAKVLSSIDLDKIRFVGYAFQIEMKFACWTSGFRIKEVPIIFTDRLYGDSKMHKGIISEAIVGVLKMKWRSFFRKYRLQTS